MKRYLIMRAAVLGLVFFPAYASLAADGPAYLGVFLSPLPEALSDQVGADSGVMLGEVLPESPAEKAGLRRHDIVTAADGNKVAGPDALRQAIQSKKPGDPLRLEIRRGTESLEVEAKLGQAPLRPEPKAGQGDRVEKPRPSDPSSKPARRPGFLGIGFAEVDAALASHLGLEEGAGVLVGNVWRDSPAAKAGIEKNDVLVSVDGHALKGTHGMLKLLGERRSGEAVKLEVIHKGQRKTVEAVLADRPPELERPGAARSPFRFPGLSSHGRVIIENPDGSQESFDVSGDGWNADDLYKQFEDRFKDLRGSLGAEEMNERLRKLLGDMNLEDLGALSGGLSSTESRSAVVRIVDGEYEVTIRDHDGVRTVTVKQGDKFLGKDLSFDKLDTLPEEARKRVEKAAESLDDGHPAELKVEGENKIKA